MTRARSNGEGSIYWEPDRQCWRAAVTLPDGRRKTHRAKLKREAREWLDNALRAAAAGLLPPGRSPRLAAYLTDWLDNVASGRVRERTLLRYRQLLHKHVIPHLAKIALEKLTPQQIQALYRKLGQGEDAIAPQTIKHVHAVLRNALGHAVRLGLLARNPCELVDPPRVPAREMQTLDLAGVAQFLRAAAGDPLEALWTLAVTTGMRQGELLGLKWEDIDWETRSLTVRRSVCYLKGRGYVWDEPKSATGRRRIELLEIAVQALRRHKAAQDWRRRFMGDKWQEQGLVFTNTRGGPLLAANVYYRAFKPLLRRAGLPETLRFHDLRHTVASLLLADGTHPKIAQELLGHSSVRVTLDTYSHALPTLQREVMDRLEGRLGIVNALLDPRCTHVAPTPPVEDAQTEMRPKI